MRIGLIGSYGSPAQMVRLAQEAEQHGWDGFFTWDGISLDEPGFDAAPTWDPFGILAAAAVVTERITLGAMVFAPPRHRPWELAQRALTVDHLSGGRLVLPVGVGVPVDRAFTSVHGQPSVLRDRAELLDDVLGWLERSWSGEEFSYEGTHLSTGPFRFPRPPVNGRIPVWPVAVWDSARPPLRSLNRALRWDGIVPQVRGETPDDAEARPEHVAELVTWAASRRDPARGPWEVVIQGRLSPDDGEAREQLAAAADAGATWWVESWWDPETTTAEHLLTLARRRLPRL
ncbi:Coenzyme F420-dependent N5 N10-methylene tetrahydromethanopterin reductase-like protein [Xylanimonas cellulosilytica DSM 15894]|uniref:Coenzyme F420-dependent N5 N10-methylene tetrahydromethanopterin reductase-like protein n=1 Tax=Xylanimonas cellulosilytica (strain DSM 15894 / JCM 12276 / CECT 5975 / KCTC 9989 / LMG 20990 / NBRC 107835 / XIL07) TaxID=446471 RepID=D1BVQ0_XYLCX|nr:LLM class flavin-dependent oxidoreductase [Xylanimonas cellulosilytica]ACZ31369.1 Coenzyme F420-dependent N5 N10-methylene tetrahydromethanopterin reductase-like protein [Xylanimonas cellulosilytica DSM 15894]